MIKDVVTTDLVQWLQLNNIVSYTNPTIAAGKAACVGPGDDDGRCGVNETCLVRVLGLMWAASAKAMTVGFLQRFGSEEAKASEVPVLKAEAERLSSALLDMLEVLGVRADIVMKAAMQVGEHATDGRHDWTAGYEDASDHEWKTRPDDAAEVERLVAAALRLSFGITPASPSPSSSAS